MHPPKRQLGAVSALLALVLVVSGCGGSSSAGDGSGGGDGKKSGATAIADRVEPLPGPAPEPELPVTVESADGREVTVRSAERIIPLTGSLSELVHSLGLGERVVARDVTATFEEAEKLPVVTRAHDVSAESVLSLKPTLVLAESTTGPSEAIGQIRDAGVPLLVIPPALALSDVAERIDAVAGALGVPEAGRKLKERTEKRISAARKAIPDAKKPKVAFLYLRGAASVYLLGGAKSGASSLIEAAGGVDAGKESGLKKDFTAITSEALAKAAPDVILVMSKGLDSVDGVEGLLKIPGIAETPAGLDRRIASVDDGVLLNYGPRTDKVIRSLVEQFHGGGQ
ncbi:ABC transporter substrate-binding protein [Streptomyces sp. XM4193]|uniref:heme/hemin ABC transporter substrate-binding protein n=1 Tax=Streptomyces sp. XM4193 TaxID=2929782 RepID=UPI001FF7F77B|nr:ABC transporter substrate-binding protein [Streptomyces sp. XM4193]MCK1796166.1 ABC transporter substrate-binding protein [Streptomyces sp. XM4193]